MGGLEVTEDMGFILSDDRPFTEDDDVVMAGLKESHSVGDGCKVMPQCVICHLDEFEDGR